MEAQPKCYLCGCSEQKSLVRCVDVDKYLCNGSGEPKGSHILTMLKRTQTDKIEMIPGSINPNLQVSCYLCQSSNIFELGFVERNGGNMSYCICRNEENDHKDEYDWASFKPIVVDNQINPTLVSPPSNPLKVTFERANALIDDINKVMYGVDTTNNLGGQKYKKTYESIDDFTTIMFNMVRLEKKEEQRSIKMKRISGIYAGNNLIEVTSRGFKDLTLGAGFRIKIGDKFTDEYYVTEKCYPFHLHIAPQPKIQIFIPSDIKKGTKCVLIPTFFGITYDRQENALKQLLEEPYRFNPFLVDVLLGKVQTHEDFLRRNFFPSKGSYLQIPNHIPLNNKQIKAIETAFRSRFCYIQGPPGTGKTTTLTGLVYSYIHTVKQGVLVLAQSNSAVDNCFIQIEGAKLKVERFQSRARGSQYVYKDPTGNTNQNNMAKVTCATISSSCIKECMRRRFDMVIIDEGSQVIDTDIVIALSHRCSQLIIFGDHKQLGPCVLSQSAKNLGYHRTILDRIMDLFYRPITLIDQYRMHPGLCEVSNELFYGDHIKSSVRPEDRIITNNFIRWPNPENPLLFWHADTQEQSATDGKGFINRKEQQMVMILLRRMLRAGIHPKNIGIITPYVGQVGELILSIKDTFDGEFEQFGRIYEEVRVDSVDAFQGSERDFIIISNVRANNINEIGFLGDMRRLNVSITRARYGMIIIGNAPTFSKNKIWSDLIDKIESMDALSTGPIDALVPYHFERKDAPETETSDDISGSDLE